MQAEHTHLLLTLAQVLHAHVGKEHPHHQKMIEEAVKPLGEHHVDGMHEYAKRHGHPTKAQRE